MKRAQTVYVRNNGEDVFRDRYDGEDFVIDPGEAVEIEAACARLVFGFGEEDKSRAIRRLGWAPSSADMADALERLDAFSFHMEHPTRQPAPAGDTEAAGARPDPPAAADHTDETADPDVKTAPARRGRPAQQNVLEKLARANTAAG